MFLEGALPVTRKRARRMVTRVLRQLEAEGFVILADVPTQTTAPAARIDHLVIGPTGVFAIDTRPWSAIDARENRPASEAKAGAEAVRLASAEAADIERRLEGFGVRCVQPLVALAKGRARQRIVRLGGVRALAARDLPSFIRWRIVTLTPQQIRNARAALLRKLEPAEALAATS